MPRHCADVDSVSGSRGTGARFTRREVIEIGYSTALGTSLAALAGGRALEAQQAGQIGAVATPRAKSVLFLFLFGGPSHLDTFDPKPEAPAEFRGDFRPIQTAVSGVQICEHLPEIARRMDRLALVRSMTCNPSFGDHRMRCMASWGASTNCPRARD